MVMLPSAATPLLRSLNNLGAPRKQRESIAEQVAREGMSWWGAERRVLALEERLGVYSIWFLGHHCILPDSCQPRLVR